MNDPLRDAELLAADAISDVIEYWGFRKTLGRTWTMLYLSEEPLAAADISDRLNMSAGSVSTTLGELQRWGVVKRVWKPGERKEFYEAETDFWKMISKVVSEREKFLAESVSNRLDEAVRKVKQAPNTQRRTHVLDRIERLHSFAGVAQTILDAFIRSRQANFKKFGNLLNLASRTASRAASRKTAGHRS